MTLSTKLNIIFFLIFHVFFLGIAIQANYYLYFILLLVITIFLFIIQDYLLRKYPYSRFLIYIPILMLATITFGIYQNNILIKENPSSISIKVDEFGTQQYMNYSVYGRVYDTSIVFYYDDIQSGAELKDITKGLLKPLSTLLFMPGIFFFLSLVAGVLNEIRSVGRHGSRRKVMEMITSSSTVRTGGGFTPVQASIQQFEAHLQEHSKGHIADDDTYYQYKKDE